MHTRLFLLAAIVTALAAPTAEAKVTREAFPGTWYIVESENFAVKWRDTSLTNTQARVILDAAEHGWRTFIGDMGHRVPIGSDQYKLNIYIANDNDMPNAAGSGGVCWFDSQGFPYLAVNKFQFDRPDRPNEFAAVAAVHELYHAIQFSTGSFDYATTKHKWFWEASAQWAAMQAYPQSPVVYEFIGLYALHTALPIFYYESEGNGVDALHAYGYSLFLDMITDTFGDARIIRDVWESSGPGAEPLAEIERRLPGGDMPTMFSEFAAKNTIWDYEGSAAITGYIRQFNAQNPQYDPIAARVPASGTDGMVPLQHAPHAYGHSTIEITRPRDGRIKVAVHGENGVDLDATIVYGRPGSATYVPLEGTATAKEATVTLPSNVRTAYLAIAPTSPARVVGRPVSISFSVASSGDHPADEAGDSDGGAGCSTTREPSMWMFVIATVLLGARRRRRPEQYGTLAR